MITKYTEQDTENFYNQEDAKYRSFWDDDGSLHWGYFDNLQPSSQDLFLDACHHWNQTMLTEGGIDQDSHVLDLGCGNGSVSVWLAKQSGCRVTGLDLSQVRIDNALQKAQNNPNLKLNFIKGSALELPFDDNHFSHVWSQATIFHISDIASVLKEVYRVLRPGGIFVFDDLIQPQKHIGADARKYVYDRLVYDSSFSHDQYYQSLKKIGFTIVKDADMSLHLKRSYQLLGIKAQEHNYPDLVFAYQKMCQAIDENQLGWSFFLTKK